GGDIELKKTSPPTPTPQSSLILQKKKNKKKTKKNKKKNNKKKNNKKKSEKKNTKNKNQNKTITPKTKN
ncbi:hypothetical protein ACNIS0_24240, partial [Escherichia coli]